MQPRQKDQHATLAVWHFTCWQ